LGLYHAQVPICALPITCLTRPTINHNRKLSLDTNKFLQKTQKLCTTKTQRNRKRNQNLQSRALKTRTHDDIRHTYISRSICSMEQAPLSIYICSAIRAQKPSSKIGGAARVAILIRSTVARSCPSIVTARMTPSSTVYPSTVFQWRQHDTAHQRRHLRKARRELGIKCIRTGQHHRPTPTFHGEYHGP
jgi:hypothetical protein